MQEEGQGEGQEAIRLGDGATWRKSRIKSFFNVVYLRRHSGPSETRTRNPVWNVKFLVRSLSTAGYAARPTKGRTAGLNQKVEGNTIRSLDNLNSSFPRCQNTSYSAD